MTRARRRDMCGNPPRHSDWQRPSFHFEGKGAAGGHSTTSRQRRRPQPVE
ncbi:hypothetical protein KCP74_20735 [Salmonella enterica subsp. enterica]|nr:hypothetical protein KCP74_20735 [Salmonella enterica subsp. enterica]